METREQQPSPDSYQRNSKRSFASVGERREDTLLSCVSPTPVARLLCYPPNAKAAGTPAENGDTAAVAWNPGGPVAKRQRTLARTPASSIGGAEECVLCCPTAPLHSAGVRRTDGAVRGDEQGPLENSVDDAHSCKSGSMEVDLLPRTEASECVRSVQAPTEDEKPTGGPESATSALETLHFPSGSRVPPISGNGCYAIMPFNESSPLLEHVISGEKSSTGVSSESFGKALPLSQMLKHPAVRGLLAGQPADPLEELGRQSEGYLFAEMTRRCGQTELRRNPLLHAERAAFEKTDGAQGARLRTAFAGQEEFGPAAGERRCEQKQNAKDDISESVDEATMLEEETLF
ncbi:hypothetical protein CSUI_008130 [Cystoisospora suis]|uniref:Uncharacterized protein n=1 Tax=Cystoisospora suis TaxID=483139 RepID=A0A2C6KB13_9APIC|nr:hypothetical protein CSUI_008130 [Cystoisospora suis]